MVSCNFPFSRSYVLLRLSLVPINSHIGCRIYTQSDDDAFEGVVRRSATRGRLIFSFSFVPYVHDLLFEYSPLRYLRRNPLYSGNSLALLFLPHLNPTYSSSFPIAVNYFSERAFHFTGSMDKLRSDSS